MFTLSGFVMRRIDTRAGRGRHSPSRSSAAGVQERHCVFSGPEQVRHEGWQGTHAPPVGTDALPGAGVVEGAKNVLFAQGTQVPRSPGEVVACVLSGHSVTQALFHKKSEEEAEQEVQFEERGPAQPRQDAWQGAHVGRAEVGQEPSLL